MNPILGEHRGSRIQASLDVRAGDRVGFALKGDRRCDSGDIPIRHRRHYVRGRCRRGDNGSGGHAIGCGHGVRYRRSRGERHNHRTGIVHARFSV